MIDKSPETPDALKQQTLDCLVKKSKHGRNLSKKYDAVKKEQSCEVKQPDDHKTNDHKHPDSRIPDDTTTKPYNVLSNHQKTPENVLDSSTPHDTKSELQKPKKEPKKITILKREPKKAPTDTRPARSSRNGKKDVKSDVKALDEKCQKLTDFYPVRRSKRQPLSKIKDLEYQELKDKIQNKCRDGLEIRLIEEKGRGIFTTRPFARKEFIIEYSGTLISYEEAKKREAKYASEPDKYGCYMYYFVFKSKKYCVDGTAEDGSYGRLLNHSVSGNVESKLVNISNKPVLVMVANTDIPAETELCYDYGERSKDIIQSHPWLTQ